MLRQGRVLVNGAAGAAEDRIAAGSIITIPDSAAFSPNSSLPIPNSSLLLDILREEPDLLFLNKPAGLAVHGPGSLDEQVRAYLRDTLSPSLSFRPGPLHRLDKPTSGIIVFSKTLAGARSFSALLREGRIRKQYLALVEGHVEEAAVWEDLLVRDKTAQKTFSAGPGGTGKTGDRAAVSPGSGGAVKKARTRIRPLAVSTGPLPGRGMDAIYSLILAEIETGRTHQIRAQAAARGFPLAGDNKYGGGPQTGGFLLHAWKLELPGSPGGRERPLAIRAPLPEQFRLRIQELFGGASKIHPEL
jgi:23S rRNA pseudouridine955/2504/2580 synthase